MATKPFTRILLVTLILMVLLSACGPSNGLLGKWKEESSGMTFDFQSNGKLVLSVPGGVSMEIQYVSSAADAIIIKGSGSSGSTSDVTMNWKVSGDTLTLTSGGQSQTLKRTQ